MFLSLFDYWVVKKGQETAYSEEDELIRRMQEETGAVKNVKEGDAD